MPAASRVRFTTSVRESRTAAKSEAGRASRQIVSHTMPARVLASTRSCGSAAARLKAVRIRSRLTGSHSPFGRSARSRSSASAGCVSSSCDRPASTAICSPRAAAPPAGIIAEASQFSTDAASLSAAMRENFLTALE